MRILTKRAPLPRPACLSDDFNHIIVSEENLLGIAASIQYHRRRCRVSSPCTQVRALNNFDHIFSRNLFVLREYIHAAIVQSLRLTGAHRYTVFTYSLYIYKIQQATAWRFKHVN